MKEFILHKQGGVSGFKLEKMTGNLVPREGEVLVKHTAVGVNFFDIHFRRGDYNLNKLPAILGLEAAGYIEALGSNVQDYKVGDRVAYATGVVGSYAHKRVVKKDLLIKLPGDISDVVAAGSLLKGMMAHTLLNRVYVAVRGKRILVHAAAGGVGQFLCAFAKEMGLEVIGTVGRDEKIPFAKSFGCDHVINYAKQDFVKEVEKITNGTGVGIVYDSVGKDTFLKSLECLWPMGICVSYGESSGKIPPFDIEHLLLNSLYLTKPTLALYKANRIELALSAAEVFAKIRKGVINPKIITHNFDDLPKIHEKMERRATVGSQVLIFSANK